MNNPNVEKKTEMPKAEPSTTARLKALEEGMKMVMDRVLHLERLPHNGAMPPTPKNVYHL